MHTHICIHNHTGGEYLCQRNLISKVGCVILGSLEDNSLRCGEKTEFLPKFLFYQE